MFIGNADIKEAIPEALLPQMGANAICNVRPIREFERLGGRLHFAIDSGESEVIEATAVGFEI